MEIRNLKGRNQIAAAFRRGKRFYASEALVAVTPRIFAKEPDAPKGGEYALFLVCSVPKKIAPHAVVRNRIKRLVRESVRLYIKQYQFERESQFLNIMTLAFNWQSAPLRPSGINLHDIYPIIENMLNAASAYYAEKALHKSIGQ